MKKWTQKFPSYSFIQKKVCFLAGLISFGHKTFDLEVPSRMIRLLPGVFRTLGFVPHSIQLRAEVIYLLPQLIQLLNNHHTVSCNKLNQCLVDIVLDSVNMSLRNAERVWDKTFWFSCIRSKMLFSSLNLLLMIFKTISPQKLFRSDEITL